MAREEWGGEGEGELQYEDTQGSYTWQERSGEGW